MNVDRSRFLLLAAALSANACTIKHIDNRGRADSAPIDDAESADTGAAIDSTAGDSAPADSAVTDAASDASDAPVCTDEGVTVPACTGTTPGGCELDTLPACGQFSKFFKPRSAKLAIDCVVKLPTCEGTTTDPVWDCAYPALEGACPDSTADAYCAALAASCPAVADAGTDAGAPADLKTQCMQLVPGLNADGRARLKTLVTDEGGCITPLRDLLPSL